VVTRFAIAAEVTVLVDIYTIGVIRIPTNGAAVIGAFIVVIVGAFVVVVVGASIVIIVRASVVARSAVRVGPAADGTLAGLGVFLPPW